MSRATWRISRNRFLIVSVSSIFLYHFHGTLRQSIHECLAILFGEDAIIQRDNDAGISPGADQAAYSLAKFQNRFGQREFPKGIATAGFDGFDARFDEG